MKRAISVVLVFSLMLSMGTIAFADSGTAVADRALYLTSVGHGQYNATISRTGANGEIVATPTEDEEIYHLSGNQYVTHAYGSVYQLTERIDINTNNMRTTGMSLDIPEHIRENISQTITEQQALGNNDFQVSVFLPVSNDLELEPQGQIDEWDAYYTFQGSPYVDYFVKYWDLYQVQDTQGTNSYAVASAFVSLIITVVGVFYPVVELFGYAESLAGIFVAARDAVPQGSSDDYVHVMLTYAKLSKTTQRLDAAMNFLNSDKVWLDTLYTQQLFPDVSNVPEYYNEVINEVYYTSRYHTSCEWIVTSITNDADPPVRISLLGVNHEF